MTMTINITFNNETNTFQWDMTYDGARSIIVGLTGQQPADNVPEAFRALFVQEFINHLNAGPVAMTGTMTDGTEVEFVVAKAA